MQDEPLETPTNAEHDPPSNSGSNQNLIIGIVLGAVVLLILLLIVTRQFDSGSSGQSDSDPDLAALRDRIEEEQRLNEQLRLNGLGGAAQSPELLVEQIKSDTEALGQLVNASRSDAAALRTARADASALAKTNETLSAKLDQYRAAAMRAQDLQQQVNQLRQTAADKVDQSQLDQLRSELDLVKGDRDRLQSELSQLRGQRQNMVDPNTYALLKSELDEMRADYRNLRSENQRLLTELAGAKLFVTNIKEDLSPRAVALLRELKKMEDQDHRQRIDRYTAIQTQLKATVEETISFKTNSASVAREHESHLKEMTEQAPAKAFFLVVGYASPSGDSLTNEELSSKRATRVASMVNYLKKEGQAVQAVYLGEGTRFGPEDAPNQVCEVWEIRP